MKNRVNDAYKHCFAHICATGVTTIMSLKEVLSMYTDSMCKDLEDCGVKAEKSDVVDYIAKQYETLKSIQNKDVAIARI